MHLLISFNHDMSFTQERKEEGRGLSEIYVAVHYVYTGLKKVTIL